MTILFSSYQVGIAEKYRVFDETGALVLETDSGSPAQYTVFGLEPGELRTYRVESIQGDSTASTSITIGLASARYTISHYIGTNGNYSLYQTTSHTGLIASMAKAEALNISGYVFQPSCPDNVLDGRILWDGSLVLHLYYDRLPERAPNFTSPQAYPDYSEDLEPEPEREDSNTLTAVVTCRNLNMRLSAGTELPPIGMLSRGTLIQGELLSNGWFRVQQDNQTVYLSADYLEILQLDSVQTAPMQIYFVTCRNLNVRILPTTNSERIQMVHRGDVLIGHPLQNGWLETNLDGTTCYVSMLYLTKQG